MPTFQPGDWIKHRQHNTPYRVIYVHADGQIVVEDPTGQMHILTRPEVFERIPPPDDPGKDPALCPAKTYNKNCPLI